MRLFLLISAASVGAAFAATSMEPPKLRLSGDVRPTHYAVNLTIVPGEDTFHGTVDTRIDIASPTSVIWLNATEITIQQATFHDASNAAINGTAQSSGQDFAAISFTRPVSRTGTLHIAYEGKISRISSAGVFQLKEGDQWYVYTQFEPTDARRAFPCFDEPSFKVPWQITLHVPADDVAVANTPELSHSAENGSMKVVRFKDSKPLPSYLIAFAVGPFDIVDAGKLGPTPLRVITPRGKGPNAKYAREAIPQLLKLLEDYFGIPYPYEKLDSIVMPISNFAMENAGLITYGETALLAKPELDTIHRQRECAIVVAHEMAHQWFGDLVTTAWWNDIWLNEAFATWMENKIVGEWKPAWRMDVTSVNDRLGAMHQDTLVSTRKIRQPIESNDDIANAFDDITYQKGAAVIETFETWIGREKFRKGIQIYLKKHAWGNATAADFEAGISAAAGQDVAPAFNSFLNQAGVPEITASLDCSAKPKLNLSQQRLLPLGSEGSVKQTWEIPVCVAYQADGARHRQCELFSDPRSQMTLADAKTCPTWLEPNDGEKGYYQVNYKSGILDRVLAGSGAHLSVAERVGVLGNFDFMVGSGAISPRKALSLVPEFAADPHYEVVAAATRLAGILKGDSVPESLRPRSAAFIRKIFAERAGELGWTGKPTDSEDTRLLRYSLLPFVAGEGRDEPLIHAADQLARKWLTERNAIPPYMVAPVLNTAAEFGNRDLFDRFHQAALAEKNQQLRERLISALGKFRDPDIAKSALALLLTHEFDARESFSALLFGPLAYPETRALPFQFVQANLDALLQIIPREVGEDFAAMLPFTGASFCDAGHRDEVQSFFADRVKKYVGGPRNLSQVLEEIDLCIARRKTLEPELAEFLKQY